MVKKKTKKPENAGLTTSKFLALSDAEKERIYQDIDRKSPEQMLAESKPLTPKMRARWNKVKKNLGGRPKLGKHGAKIVSVTVEKTLLKRADAYAKANGMKRSELFAVSVAEKIGSGSAA